MTVTVKRGAGRPAAAAKTNKAAQRTALPPRAEKVEPEVVEATTRGRRKAVTGSEESPNPARSTPRTKPVVSKAALPAKPTRTRAAKPAVRKDAATADRMTIGQARERTAKAPEPTEEQMESFREATRRGRAAKPAEAVEAPVAKSTGGTRKAPAKTAAKRTRSVELAEDFPGRSKVVRLVDGGRAAGWEPAIVSADPKTGAVEVTISRGDETMTWYGIAGKQDPAQAPRWTNGTRTVMMKNISGLLAQATGERLTVKPATERKPRAARVAAGDGEPVVKPLPFDPAAASDQEVVDALRGHRISWRNGISRAIESAVVNTTGRVKIEAHPRRETRVVTFNDPQHTGGRSVALDRLTSVS